MDCKMRIQYAEMFKERELNGMLCIIINAEMFRPRAKSTGDFLTYP